MYEILNQINKVETDLEKQKAQEIPIAGGGGGSVSDASTTVKGISKLSVAPVSSTNPIAVGDNDSRMTNSRTPTGSAGGVLSGTYPNPALAQDRVNLQGSSPGTAQTGSARVSVSLGADTRFYLNSTPIIESGTSFPGSPVDGQRYRHETYRAWFVYNSTDALWRQEAPGVFASSFPTVASGDNTVAPKIEVKRLDRNNRSYYWDGARWLSTIDYSLAFISRSNQPFAQGVVGFDLTIPNYAAGGGFYFTSFSIGVFPNTAQSSTNFYTVSAQYTDTSGAGTNFTFTANNDTKTFTTSGRWWPLSPTFTPVAVTTHTAFMLYMQMTPTANPGTFYMAANVTFQLIG